MKSQIVNSSRKLLLDIDLPKRVNVAKSGANEAALLTINIGCMRSRTKGLLAVLAPIIIHIIADSTIFIFLYCMY
ncbi:hypothetical protein [Francisella sp. SYW-2]|uniref:hypothetical protein n=1 Tax=Francisella sp. SYW-2 TaxID=2610886 RepID=UPI00123D49DB|nr:hypothetical protein [Francisella sp. SYW-2]